MSKRELVVQLPEGFHPEVAPWVWALEETRRRTKRAVEGLAQAQLDWKPEGAENSTGTLLYHLAATEADWLYSDVMGLAESDWPPQAQEYFAAGYWVSGEDRRLVPVLGKPVEQHFELLDAMRGLLLEAYRGMSPQDYRRPRETQSTFVTPEWVLYHLNRHEAEHQGQIVMMKAMRGRGPG